MGHFVDAEGFRRYVEKQKELVSLLEEHLELLEKKESNSTRYESALARITNLKQEIKQYEDTNIFEK